MPTRSWVCGMLWKNIVIVTFSKKDGTLRTIRGTQDPTRIPFYKTPDSSKRDNMTTSSACPIFDLDLQEWRSFRWDSIINITNDSGLTLYDVTLDGLLKQSYENNTTEYTQIGN